MACSTSFIVFDWQIGMAVSAPSCNLGGRSFLASPKEFVLPYSPFFIRYDFPMTR